MPDEVMKRVLGFMDELDAEFVKFTVERGMRILNGLVTTLLDGTFRDGESHSVVDGGDHVATLCKMFAPAPHVLGAFVSNEIGTPVE